MLKESRSRGFLMNLMKAFDGWREDSAKDEVVGGYKLGEWWLDVRIDL